MLCFWVSYLLVGFIEIAMQNVVLYYCPTPPNNCIVQPLRHDFRLLQVHHIRHCKCSILERKYVTRQKQQISYVHTDR